jgi:deoxycytidine triphosphate deaminase
MAVLGDRDIHSYFDYIFAAGTAQRDQIRAAKYYLTLGERFLILPDGTRVGEADRPRRRPFVLEPGQTALVSTKEKLVIPSYLSAVVGPVFDLSDNGILFFGGMLIDPGFGLKRDGDSWTEAHEPLSFYLANVGSQPRQFSPGKDRVASIAFLPVTNAHTTADFPAELETTAAREAREELFDSKHAGPSRALGLVEDIGDIRHRVDKFEVSTQQVVLFGVIVLAITLFAAIVTLAIDDPATREVSSLELSDVTKTIGLAVAELAVLVSLFYVAVSAVVKFRDRPRRKH